MLRDPHLMALVDLSLAEDLGPGDLTCESIFPDRREVAARFVAREPLVVCGLDMAAAVFGRLDPACRFSRKRREGDRVRAGSVLAAVRGPVQAVLGGERTALNFVRHLSGIATLTRRYAEALKGSACVLLDTRKTLPGYRRIEKAAVRAGGGHNHRMGLFDGVMIKDNHILAAGSISRAVRMARARIPPTVKIEVECSQIRQVRAALSAGADIIMLDNMPPARMRKAVEIVSGRALVEASGRLDLDTVRAAADCGVDFVSVGAITHGARAVDVAMDLVRS
ncbi:MAG: carboxylating nicotinate-nucleotide diphosphorylase [Deltaproteobacteria bacterium]|nr:carboxylating nicotinate-nucleotide diphosphorylase [Deltaproteobacteria bacterium]